MKIQQFEGCSVGADTFLTGARLTVFDKEKKHRIDINVVNPYTVYSGCGYDPNKEKDYECLGAGSLELIC
jgi:hypothetical protein